jgi:hypothetical protein
LRFCLFLCSQALAANGDQPKKPVHWLRCCGLDKAAAKALHKELDIEEDDLISCIDAAAGEQGVEGNSVYLWFSTALQGIGEFKSFFRIW